jgi:putative heme-binding domain-containing protein
LKSATLTYLTLLVFAAISVQAETPGQATFSGTCAACHGLDGRGGEHAPDIATSARIQALSTAQLEKIVRDGIPAAGMPGFGSTFQAGQITEVIQYLRVLQGHGKTVTLPGDPIRGREIFFGRARCGSCHIVAGEGGFLGADLSAYGANHGEADIRQAIVKPDSKGTVSVTTREGQKFLGLLRNEDNFSLQLQTPDGQFHFFDKQALAHIDRHVQPLMPQNYASQLSKAELDDVISFLMKAPGTAASPPGGDEYE